MVEDSVTSRVLRLSERLQVSIVESSEVLEQVGSLRYACYRKEGVIDENPEEKLLDRFDGDSSHPTFAVSDGSGVVASIRISLLKGILEISPSTLSFPDEVARLVVDGLVVDPNRFVIDRRAASLYPDLHLFVLTIPFTLATVVGAAYALASVRPEHRGFYARTLRYREIAIPRSYLGLTCKLGLMCASFQEERDAVVNRNPYFGSFYEHTDLIKARFAPIIPKS